MSYQPDPWGKHILSHKKALDAVRENVLIVFMVNRETLGAVAMLEEDYRLIVADDATHRLSSLFPEAIFVSSLNGAEQFESLSQSGMRLLEYHEVLRHIAMLSIDEAVSNSYRYACECELDQGRIRAFDLYESLRRLHMGGV